MKRNTIIGLIIFLAFFTNICYGQGHSKNNTNKHLSVLKCEGLTYLIPSENSSIAAKEKAARVNANPKNSTDFYILNLDKKLLLTNDYKVLSKITMLNNTVTADYLFNGSKRNISINKITGEYTAYKEGTTLQYWGVKVTGTCKAFENKPLF